MKEEICEECIGIIGLAEQAYVYEGRIVCEQCDKKLRQEDRQDWKSPDAEDTWLNQESEELFESVEAQEHKELEELKEPEEPQESEEIFELLQRQELEELGELKEPEQPQESRERKEPQEFQEAEESTELQKPNETEEPIAGPVEAEQVAEMPEVDNAKPLPRRRKRISTRESKLLPFLLGAWSIFALFLLFYVPDRYAEVLRNSAFGDELQLGGFADDCLILFFMALWFFGVLGLYVVIIGSDEDEKTNEKLRTLRLLGF